MIKVVLQAIPSYIMGFFFFFFFALIYHQHPGESYENLLVDQRGWEKMSWMAWRKLCEPKANGRMGFWNIHCFNLAS